MTYRAWKVVGGLGMLLLAGSLASSLPGCSKKKTDEEAEAKAEKNEAAKKKKKEKPLGDRYADGKRLEAALKDWVRRWGDTADLPACDPLLKDPAGLELCKTAGASLTTLKTAVAKPEPDAVLLHAAAELALATELASEKLRLASMEKMQGERKNAPPGSSGRPMKPPPGSLSAVPKVRPIGSSFTSAGKMGDALKPGDASTLDPSMQVLQAYSRVNRAALRYISQFLQFGALPTRQAAFTELEALSKRKETWPALGRTLREAAMAENDPDLQGKLKALSPKLSRRPPTSVEAPGASPLAPSAAPAPAAPTPPK